MATLTVWKFHTTAARRSARTLERLQQQELIKVHDAAIVTWPEGKKKPKTQQLNNLTGAGALGGAFWGLLFGLIFFVPLLGMAVGAATGALTGSLTTSASTTTSSAGAGAGHPGDLGAVPHVVRCGRGQGGRRVRRDRRELSPRTSPTAGGRAGDAFAEED